MPRSVSLYTIPRFPCSEEQRDEYARIVQVTGGTMDGGEMTSVGGKRLYFWWAFYRDKSTARSGKAALKWAGFAATMRHPSRGNYESNVA